MTWVKIFDAAVMPSSPQAVWDAGWRVFAGYAGSQPWKEETAAEIAKWMTPAHPFSCAGMFESDGSEPIDSPADGTAHARAARAAWSALGYPDTASIAYAVDRNVTMAQVKGPVAKYFELVGKADPRALPIGYIENDGGEWLTARGLIAGTFVPAAYSWGNPPVLVTPDNAAQAAPHALWLQEHNGETGPPWTGGNVDIGHIRDDAPIWWSDDMGTPEDVWNVDTIRNPNQRPDSPGHTPPGTNATAQADYALGDTWQLVYDLRDAVAATRVTLVAIASKVGTLDPATVAAIAKASAAAVIAALPPSAGGDSFTEAQVAQLHAAAHAEVVAVLHSAS